jgi:hypothetical protein
MRDIDDNDKSSCFGPKIDGFSSGIHLMNNLLIATLETLLVIVLPLIILYLKGNWQLRTIILCLLSLPVVWYLTYAPIHELSHVAGTYLAGGKIADYKLIPRFWLGEFQVAWVTPVGLTQSWQQLVMTTSPYILDVVSVLAGLFVLRRGFSARAFILGLVFLLLCLRPAFDIVCEFVGLLSGFQGDLFHIQETIGEFPTWSFVVLSLGLSLVTIATIVRRFVGFPETVGAKTQTGGNK